MLQASRIEPEVGKGAVRLSLGKDSVDQQVLVGAFQQLVSK